MKKEVSFTLQCGRYPIQVFSTDYLPGHLISRCVPYRKTEPFLEEARISIQNDLKPSSCHYDGNWEFCENDTDRALTYYSSNKGLFSVNYTDNSTDILLRLEDSANYMIALQHAVMIALAKKCIGFHGVSNALPDDYLDSLDQLIDRGWLTIKANKIMIHPVIQIVCREELKATDEICTPFLQNISQQRDKYEYNTTCITEMAELYSNACRDLSTGTGDWQLCAAAFWKKLAKFEIALSYELQTISILETLPTYLPMDLFVAYNNTGNTYNKLGSTDLALRYYLKAIDIWNNNIRSADMLVAICYDNVGVLYTEQNNPEKGLKYSTHALQIMEAVCSTTSPEIANCHNSIGSAFHDLKQYEQAIYHKLRALDIRQKLLPENHPDIGLSYENVGTTYDALGEHSMALHYDLKAVQILEKSLPDGHPELAFCCANLGAVYCNLNDNENALIYLLKAVKMLHTTLPASHQSFIAVYLNISAAYYQSGNFKESLNYAQLAHTIAIKSLSEDHPTRKLITHVLADLELQNTTLSKESPQ